MKKYVPLLFFTLLVGCDSKAPETESVVAKFSTMQECLASIKLESGHDLLISGDDPDGVYGRLHSTTYTFSCDKEVTGSEGTYYLGWYEKPKGQPKAEPKPKPKTPKPSFEVFAKNAYYDAYKKESWPDLHSFIGNDGIARLKDLDRKAIKFAYSDPLCNQLDGNGVSMERTTKEELVVFIDCEDPNNEWKPYRIYVSESDVNGIDPPKS